jgi:hypothetical protein
LLEPAGFAIAGKPLGAPLNAAKLKLPPGTRLAVEVDLAAALLSAGLEGDFELDWLGDPAGAQKVRRIEAFETSDSFLDEAKFTTADLAQFRVLMVTNQGPMEVEFWPEVAPNLVPPRGTGLHDPGRRSQDQGSDEAPRVGHGQRPADAEGRILERQEARARRVVDG